MHIQCNHHSITPPALTDPPAYKLDQAAKTHLANSFQDQLDEKDEMIKALRVQIDARRTHEHDMNEKHESEVKTVKEQVGRLEALLNKCRDKIKYGTWLLLWV